MSNWTETRIPQFNPYVHQLPVNEMLAVGMEKQRRYDEGVQKIQQSVDRVIGLDIAKDVDRNYLQTKLNSLGDKLKIMSVGDFSNYQLANSVAGMATDVGKDKYVQNAVIATARLRKETERMEEARKAGKSSVQNEAFFNEKVNKWYNSPNVGESFSDRYIDYIDVDKKLREVAEKLHETDSSIDNIYQTDSKGNTIYYDEKGQASLNPSMGKPRVDDAVWTTKIKGKPAEKILANFYDSLNENDQQQLQIDSWYHYKDATKDDFKRDIITNYNNAVTLRDDQIINLQVELQTNTKLTQAQKDQYTAKINALNTSKESNDLYKELTNQLSEIDRASSASSYAYKVYTQKYLTNLAKDLSYESYSREVKDNPYVQADLARKKLQLEYIKERNDQSNFLTNLQWEKEKFAITKTIEQAKLTAQKIKENGGEPIWEAGKVSTSTTVPTLLGLQNEIDDIQGVPASSTQKGKAGDIDKLNSKYTPLIPDTKGKTPEEVRKYFDQLADAYHRNPSFINTQSDPNVKKYLLLRRQLDMELAIKTAQYNELKEKTRVYDVQIENLTKNSPSVNIHGTVYTPKEILLVMNDMNNYSNTKYENPFEIGKAPSGVTFDANSFYEKYKNSKFNTLAELIIKNNKGNVNIDDRNALSYISKLQNEFKINLDPILRAKSQFETDYLREHMIERQTSKATLSVNNKADMDAIQRLAIKKADEFNRGIQSVTDENYNPTKFNTLITTKDEEKNQVGYTIEKKYDGSADLIATKGTEQQILKMSKDEFESHFPKYASNSPTIDDIKSTIKRLDNKTTNVTGLAGKAEGAINARYSGYDIPQLANTPYAPYVRMDVIGGPDNDGGLHDEYQICLYINNHGNWIPYRVNDTYTNDDGLMKKIDAIGTKTIDEILSVQK